MKTNCEKCNKAIKHEDIAFVCSYECTFCEECTKKLNAVCPNCRGELLRRPRRITIVANPLS